MNRLNPREQRLVALGLLMLALALAWLLVAQPVLEGFQARRAEREVLADTFRRDARLVRSFPNLRADRRAQAASAAEYAFGAPSEAAARGAAEAQIVGAVSRVGGVMHALRVQPAAPGVVRLRADAALTLPALEGFLRALQDGRPFTTVESLSAASDASATASRLSPLEVRVDVVYAYAAPDR